MRTPTLYIINDWDRPHAPCIARKRKDGKFNYVHPSLRNKKDFHGMNPTRPTPLENFGILYSLENGILSGRLTGPSSATYQDGRPRPWQGSTQFEFNYGSKKAASSTL